MSEEAAPLETRFAAGSPAPMDEVGEPPSALQSSARPESPMIEEAAPLKQSFTAGWSDPVREVEAFLWSIRLLCQVQRVPKISGLETRKFAQISR